jgi:beta-phosphoglucomutase family hydrolase
MANHRIQFSFDLSDGLCFGCGQNNPSGLKLKFKKDGAWVRAEFTPAKEHQGWPGVLHGGVIATLLDEGMGWATRFAGLDCVTARLQVSFRRPIPIGERLLISGRVVKNNGKTVETEAKITLPDGTLMAEGAGVHAILNRNSKNRPGGQLEAVIWDMDGVIVDSAPYHFRSWQEVFGKRGVTFSEEEFRRHFGQRNDTIIRFAFKDKISAEEVIAIADEKEALYREKIASNLKPHAGAIELVKALKAKGIKMAIASSAPMENIQLILRGLGIADYFQAIVWGREVTEGKPSPQAFLLAAEKLGVQPENCLVIEDAVAGVSAAKRAGMKCIAVTTTNPSEKLQEADLIVNSLAEVSTDLMAGLFR